ncbi:MAG TPA: hypothetical protein ENJ45_01120 [Phaeodactylibacter sp.]|nr:hypothetical protein [Phaeodactylibacter sp.]
MDDDENGFKDDYFGYNTVSMNGNLPLMSIHGTEVFGIMAAKADNGTGVAGVNWNVKLMPINNDLLFSEIVESYEYVLKMRKLYNESKGELGAFIVTTNASFGTSGFPSDMPVFSTWCEFYDSLGVAGILSVGATSNDAVDIDIEGDMPTSCTSDFLVTVTAISRTNALIGGYSSTNIDIAAPGDNSPSTKPNNGYGNISGTSAAAPHVAGAIALLYSTPCEEWAQYARDDPPGAALLMKDFLLRSAAPLDALKGKSVSGGLLDVKGAFDEIQNYCGSFTGALDILTLRSSISDGTISIDYQTPKEGPYTLRVFDALGRLLIDMPLNLEAFDKKTLELDVRSFARGVYFLSIENVENIVAKPFVVF